MFAHVHLDTIVISHAATYIHAYSSNICRGITMCVMQL